ncbi:MAG TPA: LpxD N-terminal domain-containing protein, partial [Pirellulales bacterium]|nr:LpxD N-terminal domain-containing protein [Pirellulales bacterium]
MASRLATLAELIAGRLVGTVADGELMIDGAATLDDAEPGDISLLDSPDKSHRLVNCRASALVVPTGFSPERLPAIQVDDVHAAFAAIVTHFRPLRQTSRIGISPAAIVSPTARVGEDVEVQPGAMIGDHVEIGARS